MIIMELQKLQKYCATKIWIMISVYSRAATVIKYDPLRKFSFKRQLKVNNLFSERVFFMSIISAVSPARYTLWLQNLVS